MEQQLDRSPAPVAIPPAPVDRPVRRRPAMGRTAILIVVSWTVVGALLVRQQVEIGHARIDAAAATAYLGARLDDLTAAQTAIEGELDDSFDAAAVVASARTSVLTVVAGRIQGSAFVIDSRPFGSTLVTNFHVIARTWRAGGRSVVVRGADRTYDGELDRVFPDIDIALIDVPVELPAIAADPVGLEVGDPVVVLGSPFGWAGSATDGSSAIHPRYVQFSAPVSPGSSEGAPTSAAILPRRSRRSLRTLPRNGSGYAGAAHCRGTAGKGVDLARKVVRDAMSDEPQGIRAGVLISAGPAG